MAFSFLGLGSLSFTAVLTKYRFVFLVLTLVSLEISFYLNYIKAHSHISSRIIFWISVVIAAGFLSYAYL